MSVKVLMTWDISSEQDQEYFEFMIGEFVPGVQKLGLQPSEAWVTIYGPYPQIQVALLADNAPTARNALDTNEWSALLDRLMSYIKNYTFKVIPARGGFQF
jgi:hypothetical protein